MKLLDLYKSLLSVANLTVTNDGCVSLKQGKKTRPATYKGKRIVLPTPEHLANPNWEERIAFHPLSENIMRGVSDVLTEYRNAINIRLNGTVGLLSVWLLRVATSTDMHAQLNPDQSEFLSKLKHADNRTLEDFDKILDAMPVKSQKKFVHIFLKRTGTVHGKAFGKVGVTSFPFYEELKKGGKEIWGVTIRVKDRETYIALMEYIFPNIGTPEAYNCGSNSLVAPWLDSLMHATMAVTAPLNDLVELFSDQLDNPEELLFDSDWVESFNDLEALVPQIRGIPMQAGNEGATPKAEAEAAALSGQSAPSAPAAPVHPMPVAQAQPGHNLPSVLRGGPMVPPTPAGYPGYPAPGYPGQVVSAPAGQVVHTKNGVDFDSLIRNNPVLAQQGQGAPMFGGMHTGGAQPNVPRWAQPQQGMYPSAPVPGGQYGYQPMNYPPIGRGRSGF